MKHPDGYIEEREDGTFAVWRSGHPSAYFCTRYTAEDWSVSNCGGKLVDPGLNRTGERAKRLKGA